MSVRIGLTRMAPRRPAALVAEGLLAAFLLCGAVPSGPKVGERVPDFQLKDQNGVEKNLASILRPKGALLVFFRSADW